jgi:pyruvyl transferase EpsI
MNLNRLFMRIKLLTSYIFSETISNYLAFDKVESKVIVALAADYGNLGDVAITYAQTVFLENLFPHAEIIDFPISKTFSHMKSLKTIVNSNDIITIVGGGNTGDMYDDIEFCRQFIIKQFPKNKIVCFPQTIDFSDTKFGKKALAKAVKVYSNHKNLSISVRECTSYEKYHRLFPKNNIILAPDIVLSLDLSEPSIKRSGATFVLRADSEKNMSVTVQNELISMVSENYSVRFHDTHINKSKMSVEERKLELDKIWNVFRESEIVITDRLHGMIFCAITNTPCVAIDNSNKKVSGVYDAWLKGVPTIRILESLNADELRNSIERVVKEYNNKNINYSNKANFSRLIKMLKE